MKFTAYFSTELVLCLILICSGCTRSNEAKSQSDGKAEESRKFWEAFNQAAVAGEGLELLHSDAEQSVAESPEDAAVAFRDIANVEIERCRKMSSLPVLNVAPDLTAYAVEYVKIRTELAGMLTDLASLIDAQREVLSGPNLFSEFILNLMTHANDKEETVLWNALKDQATQTGRDLQHIKPVLKNIETRAPQLKARVLKLKADELSLRSKLSQKFNIEFPANESYYAAKPLALAPPLSREQLMRAMFGQKIGGWTFEEGEFKSFTLLKFTQRPDNTADYEVITHVKGRFSGDERDFKLRMIYKKIITRWKLVKVEALQ